MILIGYMALGQLAASYLQSSLDGLAHELTWIGTGLSGLLPQEVGTAAFENVAPAAFAEHRPDFPRRAAPRCLFIAEFRGYGACPRDF